jgi:hypothetical protein
LCIEHVRYGIYLWLFIISWRWHVFNSFCVLCFNLLNCVNNFSVFMAVLKYTFCVWSCI